MRDILTVKYGNDVIKSTLTYLWGCTIDVQFAWRDK